MNGEVMNTTREAARPVGRPTTPHPKLLPDQEHIETLRIDAQMAIARYRTERDKQKAHHEPR